MLAAQSVSYDFDRFILPKLKSDLCHAQLCFSCLKRCDDRILAHSDASIRLRDIDLSTVEGKQEFLTILNNDHLALRLEVPDKLAEKLERFGVTFDENCVFYKSHQPRK
jgi:hypothetical protein